MITLKQIKHLREQSGAGIADVKKALEESNGDEEKAIELLRKRGGDKAVKKSDRIAKEGTIGSYIHGNRKLAAMVVVMCETDFVARNEEFIDFANDIAMHITASDVLCLKPEDVPSDIIDREKKIWTEQLKNEGKSEDMIEKILIGKENKFRNDNALLTQAFVKNPDVKISDLLNEVIVKLGEKIEIDSFSKFSL